MLVSEEVDGCVGCSMGTGMWRMVILTVDRLSRRQLSADFSEVGSQVESRMQFSSHSMPGVFERQTFAVILAANLAVL